MNTASGMQKVWADHDRLAQQYGHALQGVFASPTSPEWCYTIGLQNRGWPELVVFGLPMVVAASILNPMVAGFYQQNKAPQLGQVLTEYSNLPIQLGEVSAEAIEEYLTQAQNYSYRNRGGATFTALQLVLSDREGRLPQHPNFDHALMDPMQPCLAPGGSWIKQFPN